LISSCGEREEIDGVIDTRKLTIAEFSDFFDEGTTIDDVRNRFGQKPMIVEDGDTVVLHYEMESDKMYHQGVRLHIIKITFLDGKLEDIEAGFSHISAP